MTSGVRLPFHLIEIQQKPKDRKKNLRYNAFTSKAFAKHTTIDEIGKPPRVKYQASLHYNSIFKREYLNGRIPFTIDHTSLNNTTIKLAWKKSKQHLDLAEILPIVLSGLADSVRKFADLAELTLSYILQHAHRGQIYQSLSHLTRPFRFLFRSRNKCAITNGLKALEKIVSSLFYAGRILIPEYEKIMSPLNTYLWGPEEKLCDDICYGQWHTNFLSTSIELALRAIEKSATGPLEQYSAFSEIKKAVPLYESEVFPLRGSSKVLHEKMDVSKDHVRHEFIGESQTNNLELRLIDVNSM